MITEIQYRLNYPSCGISTVKERALIGKEWDLVSWSGDVWEDPDEAGVIKALNSDESFLLV